MNTTELFKFSFVDREKERIKMKNFLDSSAKKILWIRGNHGFGKTQFFKNVINEKTEYKLCYVDVKIEQNSVDIISDLMIELQRYNELDFMSYVKNNYKQFYNTTYKKMNNISEKLFPKISNIVSIILSSGYYVITHSDNKKSTLNIISDYIKIILKDKKLCMCIDNFSRCNLETARIFIQIFKEFIFSPCFRACIITTSEDLKSELKDEIFRNFQYVDIEINGFETYEYYYQIMDPIFELEDFEKEDFEYLHKKCKGSPKKLSTIISKLLEKNGIAIKPYGKAKIDKEKMIDILQKSNIKFEDKDFTSAQKWVLFSYLCLTEYVLADTIKDLAMYISKRCFFYRSYSERLFDEELLALIEKEILKYDYSNNVISPCHDLDYIELMDVFSASQLKSMFSQCTYEFLLIKSEIPLREKLLCVHAKEANILGWEILNFRYGKELFHNRQFYDAQKVFGRLTDRLYKLHPMQIIQIALCSYETGNYQMTIKIFNMIKPEQLKFSKVRYLYYFYLGKSYNNIGQTLTAAELLEKSLYEIKKDSILYVQTLNVLHMYYFEIPEKYESAKKIFYYIKNNYENVYPEIWASTMRNCYNFLDDHDSLDILDKADQKVEDELQKAFIKTTKGFIFVKLDQLSEAKIQFKESARTIKCLKKHEYSYVANNLAVCYMIEGRFDTARDILIEAIFWNRTNYCNLTLQTHLMVCSSYLSLNNEIDYYFDFLVKKIENQVITDPIAKRKIYMNLAIVSKRMGRYITSNSYFEKARPYIINSPSEWRYSVLTNSIEFTNVRPSATYLQTLDFEPWFLIYAHD